MLALATPRADGLTVHARAEVLTDKAWTVPTVVGTRVYLRDRATIKADRPGAVTPTGPGTSNRELGLDRVRLRPEKSVDLSRGE